MERVITYIDGFNLYFGLKSRGWRRYYWLNMAALSQSLLRPHQTLVTTKYFTTRITGPADKRLRQNEFLEALATVPDIQVYYGHFLVNERICQKCGNREMVPSEKMTDVNIAVELVRDAFQNQMDTAIIVSADSDLDGPVTALRSTFPAKRVIAAFPPNRRSRELMNHAHGYFTIGEDKFRQNQFPDKIQKPDGHILQRPTRWMQPGAQP